MANKATDAASAQEQFTPWLERPHPIGNGIQKVYRFDNGYGASVVRASSTYGGASGLWELGVVKFDGERYRLTYETPITSDVIGYLSDDAVQETLTRIAALAA